jgi:hypothetical protein
MFQSANNRVFISEASKVVGTSTGWICFNPLIIASSFQSFCQDYAAHASYHPRFNPLIIASSFQS